MYVSNLINSVKEVFYVNTPNNNEIISAINMIIRDINLTAYQVKEINYIFTEDDSRTIDAENQTTIDLMSDTIIDMLGIIAPIDRKGDYKTGDNYSFEYDPDNYVLTLPNGVIGVVDILYDNYILEHHDMEYVKNLATDLCYCAIGNKIYFSEDIQTVGSTDNIKIIAKLNYPIILTKDEDYNYLPANSYSLLVSGAIYLLTTRPKYRDETLLALHSNIYNTSKDSFIFNMAHLTPNKEFTKQYTW